MMMKRKVKTAVAWGGFVDDELEFTYVDTGFGGFGNMTGYVKVPAVFKTKAKARVEFRDVRRVEIREVVKPRPTTR